MVRVHDDNSSKQNTNTYKVACDFVILMARGHGSQLQMILYYLSWRARPDSLLCFLTETLTQPRLQGEESGNYLGSKNSFTICAVNGTLLRDTQL